MLWGTLDAFVLDAGQRQALVALRDLAQAGVVAGAIETSPGAPAFSSRWCRASAVVPDFTTNPDAYVDGVLAECRRHGAGVALPLHDGGIEALRRRRGEVEPDVRLALATEPALSVVVDKPRLLDLAAGLGIAIPRGALVTSVTELDAILGEVGLPAVVKPAQSWVAGGAAGSRLGPRIALGREQAAMHVEGMLAAGVGVLVQEWLPGERLAVSLLRGRGRIWAAFAQRAERMAPPLGGSSVVRESIPVPSDVGAVARRLVDEVGLDGYSEVEFRRDRSGRAALMEINPRLSASVEVAVRSGVPFPSLLYAWAADLPLTAVAGYRIGVRMRWLGGDLVWLARAMADPANPDVPSRTAAAAAFISAFATSAGYDYVVPRDPLPALVATKAAVRKLRRPRRGVERGSDGADTEAVIVGAGPYGLSLSAHLSGRAVAHEILGEPMGSWRRAMPPGMYLKSEGFASNLSAPGGGVSLSRFCAERGIEYGDRGVPVSGATFAAYGDSFAERLVPQVVRERVELVSREQGRFRVQLAGGDAIVSRRVVIATGMVGCERMPGVLRELPREVVTHSSVYGSLTSLRGREVIVLGRGQSALEIAALLHEQGSDVRLLTAGTGLRWNPKPPCGPRTAYERVRSPTSPLGNGLRLAFYARAPRAFGRLSPERRAGLAFSVLGPSGAWWLRPRVEGQFPVLFGRRLDGATVHGGRVRLTVTSGGGEASDLVADHVVAATGYRPPGESWPLLAPDLRRAVAFAAGAPVLRPTFESCVPGLYFTGFAAAVSFGPLMRFVAGAEFAARQIARST